MYKKINNRLKLFKHIVFFANITVVIAILFIFYLLFSIYFIQNTNNSNTKNIFLISNIIEKPKLQTYDKNGNLVLTTADKANILENGIKAFDVKIVSKTIKLSSDIVKLDSNSDEIIFKNRPTIIFYRDDR